MNRRLALWMSCLLPLGCNSKNSTATATLTADAPITLENAKEVVAGVVDVTLDVTRVVHLCASLLTTPLPVEPEPTGTAPLVITQTLMGAGGGEAFLAFDDRDGDMTVSSDDVISLTFVGYVDGPELSGTVMFDQLDVTGDPLEGFSWTIAARANFVNLSVKQDEVVVLWNGSLQVKSEQRVTVHLLAIAVESDFAFGLNVLHAGATLGRDDFPQDFSVALYADGVVSLPKLGGTFEFSTEEAMTGIPFLPRPSAGLFELRGANSSQLQLRPLDFFNVELSLDADGDGEDEELIAAEWSEL